MKLKPRRNTARRRLLWQWKPVKPWVLLVSILIVLWYEFANQRVDFMFDTAYHTGNMDLPQPLVQANYPEKSAVNMPLISSKLKQKYLNYDYRSPKPRLGFTRHPECGNPPDFQDYFDQSLMFRSSRNEDSTIFHRLFRDEFVKSNYSFSENYSYVELGAFNGRRESNTRFFDLCLGWEGLLIEANPLKYPKLLEFRPNAHCLRYAPSCESPRLLGFHSVAFTNAAQADVKNLYDNSSLIEVPCDRLTPALVDILGGHVTLFSLDVEGAENHVLRTVDFDQIQVDIWMVESVSQFCLREDKCESREESRAILLSAGYVGYTSLIAGSDLFVMPDSKYDLRLRQDYKHLNYQRDIVNPG